MAVFIKISEKINLTTSKDKDLSAQDRKPIIDRFKKIKPDTMNISLKVDQSYISFRCGLQNKVSGDLFMEVKGKDIEINCDAIFKINIRPQHNDSFLSGKGTWFFGPLQQGEFGKQVIGEVKNPKLKNIKTASKKTDLK